MRKRSTVHLKMKFWVLQIVWSVQLSILADTRIFVYVNEIAQRGHSKVMVRTVDTDVVIIAIAHFLDIGLQELWIAFGTGKNLRYVPIQEIVATLGPEMSVAISYFHAFTGCPFSLDMEKGLHGRLGKHTQTLQRCFGGCPQNPVTYQIITWLFLRDLWYCYTTARVNFKL